MKNQAYYDRLISNTISPCEEECRVKQIREGIAFKLFSLIIAGSFIGFLCYMFFAA